MSKKIKSVDELRAELLDGQARSFFIALADGRIRSSKSISWNEKHDTFYVLNEVDDTEQTLSEAELHDKELTNIGEAIEKGAFYAY